MKKNAPTLAAACLLLLSASARAAEGLAVVFAGKPIDPVPSYRAEGQTYLDVQRVGAIYGGEVYWSQVSGRVRLTLRGRAMNFAVDSTEAHSGNEKFVLDAPLRVRASRAFVPLSFLRSDAFARWSGYDARSDADGATLTIERRATAGPVHVFSYKDRTRVLMELAPGVGVHAVARGVGEVEWTIPYGVVDGDESIAVNDGIVSGYVVHREANGARVEVKLAQPGEHWRATEFTSPHRAALDVYASGIALPAIVPADETAAPARTVASSAALKARRRVVVIDAGHGGKDPGATGARGTAEKTVTLATALELARVLRQRGDFDVVLTRSDDTFVPLSDRSKTANDLDADLFVSLHCNSTKNHRERGFEVYSVSETASDPEAEALAATENAPLALEGKKPEDESAQQILLAMTKTEMVNESAPFAALVERELAKRLDVPDRGPKQAAFYVLRGTHAPAILVEMAYLSQPSEELELGTKRFQRNVVGGVAAGIADYAKKKGWLH